MVLHVLPERTGAAAENMALDFLLLQRYPQATPRFRHYHWRAPAFTFGLSQKLEFVKTQLPAGETFDVCRRPTGGGVVDHRDDWTYTLVVPRGHPLEELRATQSYRVVHEALAAALRAQGTPAVTKQIVEQVPTDGGPAGICFQRAEIFDVVQEATGEKIAGAAQKRNKQGLLCQGSIWRPAAGAQIDWGAFHDEFVAQLARALEVPLERKPWPELNDDEVAGLTERYSSPEWMEAR
jgi:lipoate-protein ligase A